MRAMSTPHSGKFKNNGRTKRCAFATAESLSVCVEAGQRLTHWRRDFPGDIAPIPERGSLVFVKVRRGRKTATGEFFVRHHHPYRSGAVHRAGLHRSLLHADAGAFTIVSAAIDTHNRRGLASADIFCSPPVVVPRGNGQAGRQEQTKRGGTDHGTILTQDCLLQKMPELKMLKENGSRRNE